MTEKKATNNKVQNLTLTNVKKETRVLDSKTEHTIQINGKNYKIKIDDIFRQTKQHKVMDDLVDFFNEGNNRVELLDLATPYTSMLLIKHFTSLEIPDDIDKAVDTLEALVDLGILGAIINLMPESEVVKMYEMLSATVSRMKDNIAETAKEAREIAGKVENPELKEMLENGGQ